MLSASAGSPAATTPKRNWAWPLAIWSKGITSVAGLRMKARLRMPGHLPQLSLPRWTGEPLAGRSLLLLAEQGLGIRSISSDMPGC